MNPNETQQPPQVGQSALTDGLGFDIKNLNILLPEEKRELQNLYSKWELARNAKNWIKADQLRYRLAMWDPNIVNDKIWHPHFEHNLNRQRRAAIRMQKYCIPVYPWELHDAA